MAAQTAFLDFAQLKQKVTIGQVAQMLGLKLTTKGPQSRGPCPACNSGGDRALAINADGKFYCFADKKGGDAIALCAHILGKSQRDAAQQIAMHFRFAGGAEPAAQAPAQTRKPSFDAEAYLKGLDPENEVLQPLGLSCETLRHFRSGYSKTGVLRAKLAIALCDRTGAILGFCGRALDSTQITFPNGVNASDIIFGCDKIGEGEVRLLQDPLSVMQAHEVGEPAVCFLTDAIDPQQLEMLASLLDERKARLFF